MHSCRWIPQAGSGLEHLVLRSDGDVIAAEGVVIGSGDGADYGASYAIVCDAAWRVRHAVVKVAGGARLELFADGVGHWQDGEGAAIDALDGCIDIDLTASCFTNTLPIRRLGAALAERQCIDVAWVWIPELRVEKARQAYTRLGDSLVRFESLGSGFQADLTVDADGFVLDYPGLFRRVG